MKPLTIKQRKELYAKAKLWHVLNNSNEKGIRCKDYCQFYEKCYLGLEANNKSYCKDQFAVRMGFVYFFLADLPIGCYGHLWKGEK